MPNLDTLHPHMAAQRKRKIPVFPPIELNNRATGLSTRNTVPIMQVERRGALADDGRTLIQTPPSFRANDVFSASRVRSYRRLIGTPPPRGPQNSFDAGDSEVGDSWLNVPEVNNSPMIKFQSYVSGGNVSRLGHHNQHDSHDTTSGRDSSFGYYDGSSVNSLRLTAATPILEDPMTPIPPYPGSKPVTPGNQKGLVPPPRLVTWKADGVSGDVVQELRPGDGDLVTPLGPFRQSANLNELRSRMPLTKSKMPVRLVPMQTPTPVPRDPDETKDKLLCSNNSLNFG